MNRLKDLGQRIERREAVIGVVGLGYVGLPLAVEFAKAGYVVTGFDLDAKKVDALAEGNSYIEDVVASEVSEAVAWGRLSATGDFA